MWRPIFGHCTPSLAVQHFIDTTVFFKSKWGISRIWLNLDFWSFRKWFRTRNFYILLEYKLHLIEAVISLILLKEEKTCEDQKKLLIGDTSIHPRRFHHNRANSMMRAVSLEKALVWRTPNNYIVNNVRYMYWLL